MPKHLSVSLLALIAASPVVAQDYYIGLAYGQDNVEIEGSTYNDAFKDNWALFGGVRFNRDTLFYGAELDYSTSSGPYFVNDGDTWRLRGLIGTSIGDVDVFGALGVGQFDAGMTTIHGSGGADILTYGVGAEYEISDGVRLRGEWLQDEWEYSSWDFERTTFRIGILKEF